MFIGLGIGVWIVLITLVLGIARAAHRGDEMSDREGSDLLEATGVRFHTQLPRPHSTIGGVRSRPPLGRRAAASGVDQQRMIGIALQMLTVVAHHERPDGQGYPYGLSGAAIPRTARVLAIAEVYDVLTAPDSYLCPRTVEEAVEELRRVRGKAARRGARGDVRGDDQRTRRGRPAPTRGRRPQGGARGATALPGAVLTGQVPPPPAKRPRLSSIEVSASPREHHPSMVTSRSSGCL
jgi:hypothetical protein